MSNKYEEGIAFILEGDTEKEFYKYLVQYIKKKHDWSFFVKSTVVFLNGSLIVVIARISFIH